VGLALKGLHALAALEGPEAHEPVGGSRGQEGGGRPETVDLPAVLQDARAPAHPRALQLPHLHP
jgi:hypothetical protein